MTIGIMTNTYFFSFSFVNFFRKASLCFTDNTATLTS